MKSELVFDIAKKEDIGELIRLRLAYMEADFGHVTEEERAAMEKQLPDYFERKLGTEIIAFVARDGDRLVANALLQIMETASSPLHIDGKCTKVLGVYTEKEYRGQGICSKLMQDMIDYGRKIGLHEIELSATQEGYPVYRRLGFQESKSRYTPMIYQYTND